MIINVFFNEIKEVIYIDVVVKNKFMKDILFGKFEFVFINFNLLISIFKNIILSRQRILSRIKISQMFIALNLCNI